MPDPVLRIEGNYRLASVERSGWPDDLTSVIADVYQRLDESEGAAHAYGPPVVFFTFPPNPGESLREMICQIGTAITGLARSQAPLFVEDYHGLQALHLSHMSSAADIPETYRQLEQHARAMNYRLRPYWRVSLRRQRLADGNIHPRCEVAVFIDR